jgi:putative tricarboxylic transport membrane protein
MNATGIEIRMITYTDGAADAVKSAAQGEIEGVTVSLAEARSFIESGDLKCLGVMDEERNPAESFKDIPTCKEQGVDAVYVTQRGLALPKGVDDAIWERAVTLSRRLIGHRESMVANKVGSCKANVATAAEMARFMLFLGKESIGLERERREREEAA